MGLSAFAAIGAGAMFGAWIRWVLGMLLNPVFPTVPLGTLAANLGGSFIMGLAMVLVAQSTAVSPELRLALMTGFLGALTTFSTFSAEIVTLIRRGEYLWAAGAVGAHVAGALLMTGLGILLAQALRSWSRL